MAGVKMRVGALDAGLVFRHDVSPERHADNLVLASALFWASQRPDVLEKLLDQMEAEDGPPLAS
jgi:hypothetical protein